MKVKMRELLKRELLKFLGLAPAALVLPFADRVDEPNVEAGQKALTVHRTLSFAGPIAKGDVLFRGTHVRSAVATGGINLIVVRDMIVAANNCAGECIVHVWQAA
jgi:hypothetical protein